MPLSDYIGNWYAIPLPSGGFAVVLVARASRKGVLLGYFFGPRRAALPAIEDLQGLSVEDAIRVRRFGDPGITDGEWPLVGPHPAWNPEEWPMPRFAQQDPLRPERWTVARYPDDDPNGMAEVFTTDAAGAAGLPGDGLSGHLLIERVLDEEVGAS